MVYFNDMRKYQRCANMVCKVLMSTDKGRWNDIELVDISAGGLKFRSQCEYDLKTPLYFDISIYNMLSEFNLRLEGLIVRQEREKGAYLYAVKFVNMEKHCRVQLDEVIKSRITVNKASQDVLDDGYYAFILAPRTKKIRQF